MSSNSVNSLRGIAAVCSIVAAIDSHAVTLASPGFELGPDVSSISFSQTVADELGWFASNTDGERIRTTSSKPAAEGRFYASLLQNAGRYDGQPLGIGSYGNSGFDRIYSLFSVSPSTTYMVSFDHAGDNRAAYAPGTSVVEIVDADSNTTLSLMSFATPAVLDWQTVSFPFTTGSMMTSGAIAFAVKGAVGTSGAFDNVRISAIPEPSSAALFAIGAILVGALVLPRSHASAAARRGRASMRL